MKLNVALCFTLVNAQSHVSLFDGALRASMTFSMSSFAFAKHSDKMETHPAPPLQTEEDVG